MMGFWDDIGKFIADLELNKPQQYQTPANQPKIEAINMDAFKQKKQAWQQIKAQPQQAQIMVYGKYNHGKSSLLNAIFEQPDLFKAADIRMTTAIQREQKDGLIFIDTPGLDADVRAEDDAKSQAALAQSDLILFVHSLKEGELDQSELDFLNTLPATKIFMVLTHLDQVEDSTAIEAKIKSQLSQDYPIYLVASKRAFHAQKAIRQQSGISALYQSILGLKDQLLAQRQQRLEQLQSEINAMIEQEIERLNQLKAQKQQEMEQLEQEWQRDRQNIQSKERELRELCSLYGRYEEPLYIPHGESPLRFRSTLIELSIESSERMLEILEKIKFKKKKRARRKQRRAELRESIPRLQEAFKQRWYKDEQMSNREIIEILKDKEREHKEFKPYIHELFKAYKEEPIKKPRKICNLEAEIVKIDDQIRVHQSQII